MSIKVEIDSHVYFGQVLPTFKLLTQLCHILYVMINYSS